MKHRYLLTFLGLLFIALGAIQGSWFLLAIWLHSGIATTPDEALAKLRSIRPGIRLNSLQRRCLEQFARQIESRDCA